MAQYKEITSVEEWNEIYEASKTKRLLIFKHSTTCPISAEAFRQFQDFLNDKPRGDVDYCLVKVIESRQVSNEIAAALNVKHESPQAILVENQQQRWNASHWNITKPKLQEALEA